MKQHWEIEELVDGWTLLPAELELLGNKTGATRLGFAVLLKFFALEARCPRSDSEIPPAAVAYVAKQLRLNSELFGEYHRKHRSIVYHRRQIRELFDFRETTAADGEQLGLNPTLFSPSAK